MVFTMGSIGVGTTSAEAQIRQDERLLLYRIVHEAELLNVGQCRTKQMRGTSTPVR